VKRSPLWREFESGDGILVRVLRFSILAGGVLFLGFAGTLSMSWQHQYFLALLTLAIAIWMNHGSRSHLVTLTLVLLSAYSTFRYGFWRVSTVIAFLRDPAANWSLLDAVFVCLLLLAEGFAFMVLALGYMQVLWPLRRSPVPLPDDPDDWPAVDLLIPTYSEPLSVARCTALAAMNIDWPADKLHVYILDDGRREEFRAFAEEAGIGYISRQDNRNAKAGNINHALEQLDSPFVALFDCDHVPTRSFLQVTMGWMLRDPKLAVLQTPHHFYSPDPFERNLDQFHRTPGEDELFYGVVQDGNDFWNATCFCGSCAVLRRSALDQVGGLAVETVTEDAHTSLRMQMRGWNTAYINIPQAAGLATERLSAHVRQRIRWARGMVQILRIENPLLARGLKPAQRLCYFNAMAHFLFALPRLIFLTAPLIYLVFGMTSIPGFWAAIVAYALPHLVLANLTTSRIQGEHRHSFWDQIYETVLAPHILLPTLLAMISPRRGGYNVTPKGGVVEKPFFDARIARPFLLLLAFNLFGVLCAIPRAVQFPTWAVPAWLSFVNWPAQIYSGNQWGIIAVNVLWALFNMAILGVATAVASESQQRRQTVRVTMAVPSDVILGDGSMIQGITADLSGGGVRTRVDHAVKVAVGDQIKFVFPLLDGTATLPATIIGMDGSELRARFNPLSLQEDEALTMLLYSRADAWLNQDKSPETDRPLRSMGRILKLSLRGLAMTVGGLRSRKSAAKGTLAASVAPVVLLAMLAGLWPRDARAAQAADAVTTGMAATPSAKAPASLVAAMAGGSGHPATAGTFDNVFTLSELGAGDAIMLRGVDANRLINFSLPRNQLVKTATMKLRYRFSPGLLPGISQLNVRLNGALVVTLAVNAPVNGGDQNGLLEATLALPAELLVHDNQIAFEFIGHYASQCEDPANSTLWSEVDAHSTIELAGSQLLLANDLNLLPLPFYDSEVNPQPTVPIVFLTQPSSEAIQAAGIVASWFGILGGSRPVRFSVSIGTIPAGNAILIAEDATQIPPALGITAILGGTVAVRANPSDPYSSVLVVAGDNADDLLLAADALVLHGDTWQGPQVPVRTLTLPAPRQPDDAPRWLSTDRGKVTNLGQLANTGELQGDGSVPLSLTLRLPPDLDYSGIPNLAFHMSYRYNSVPLASGSTLQVYMNGAYVSSTPMPHTDKASEVLETVIPIPTVDMRSYANTMLLKFMFRIANKGNCEAAPLNLQGAVLKDSYLDITGIPHTAALPNLELFANAGYPFTRKADLADTAVVLPDRPSAGELEMFLTLMGHFGAQTGYPVLHVTVTNAAGMTGDGTRDYLVMGTVEDQPALKTLHASLPVGVDSSGLEIHDTTGFFDRYPWWRPGGSRTQDHAGFGELVSGGLPDALIEGMEWPAGSHRSVVVLVLRDPASIPNLLAAFLKSSQSADISQSVSVLHGAQFSSYRIGGDLYRVGETSPLAPVARTLQELPWLVAVVTVLMCFLMAVLVQAWLRRRARTRLQGVE
jgi:cellulose synthase (UDP-forming)